MRVGTVQYWWISVGLVIVQLRAVSCPSFSISRSSMRHFPERSWTVVAFLCFTVVKSFKSWYAVLLFPQILQSYYAVLLSSLLLLFSCTSWCSCSLPNISRILQVRIWLRKWISFKKVVNLSFFVSFSSKWSLHGDSLSLLRQLSDICVRFLDKIELHLFDIVISLGKIWHRVDYQYSKEKKG